MKGMAGWHTTTGSDRLQLHLLVVHGHEGMLTFETGPSQVIGVDLTVNTALAQPTMQWGPRHGSSPHQGKSLSKFHTTKICQEWNFSPLPHRVQVYTCLHGLFKGPVL